MDEAKTQAVAVAPSKHEKRAAMLKGVSDALVAIETEFGNGTVLQILRHMAGQLNIPKVTPISDEQHKAVFPPARFPQLYDRDGGIVPPAEDAAA